MAVGHHFVPNAVTDEFAKRLSADAQRIFRNSVTTNPNLQVHRWTTYGGVSHDQYNKKVAKLLELRLETLAKSGKLEKGKLSAAQAEGFVAGIKKDGLGDSDIRKFNAAVLKKLKLLTLGGIAIAGLGEMSKANNLASNTRIRSYYKSAVDALNRGEWQKADKYIRNGGLGGNNLLTELHYAGFNKEAAILEIRWKERLDQFKAIEAGRSVRGVPDSL